MPLILCIFLQSLEHIGEPLTHTVRRTLCQAFPCLPFLSKATGSTASFFQASNWLKQCQDHPNCGSQAPTKLPKRVIDIGPTGDPVRRCCSHVVVALIHLLTMVNRSSSLTSWNPKDFLHRISHSVIPGVSHRSSVQLRKPWLEGRQKLTYRYCLEPSAMLSPLPATSTFVTSGSTRFASFKMTMLTGKPNLRKCALFTNLHCSQFLQGAILFLRLGLAIDVPSKLHHFGRHHSEESIEWCQRDSFLRMKRLQ